MEEFHISSYFTKNNFVDIALDEEIEAEDEDVVFEKKNIILRKENPISSNSNQVTASSICFKNFCLNQN